MKTNRINAAYRHTEYDSDAAKIQNDTFMKKDINLEKIRSLKSYLIKARLTPQELKKIQDELFTDPVTQKGYLNSWPDYDFDFAVEIGYKAGVTDNVARSSCDGIEDLIGRKLERDEKTATALCYFFKTDASRKDIEAFCEAHLYNSLIERHTVLSREEWLSEKFSDEIPEFHFHLDKPYQLIDLRGDDETLKKISDSRVLSLSLEEMKVIRDYYKRPEIAEERKKEGLDLSATDVELEVLAQTWSEHCKHKIFAASVDYYENDRENDHVSRNTMKAGKNPDHASSKETIHSLYKTFIQKTTKIIAKKRKDLLSVFSDNAGVVKFNRKWAYCVKAETHNSPSALDPYGGAMTGIVGVNRDIIGTGIGARPVFNTDVFCFANPFYEKPLPEKRLHPRRIFEGVHKGVKDGGNESGIPTVNGAILFDDRFLGKPLVFCGTGGIMPLKINQRPSWKKQIEPGDLIVMTGGRIGKDGIHGATFSSAALTESSPTSAVQIGDPITQKKMLEFLIEARDRGLYKGITDNGAGGLSSSIGEMAETPGGCIIELDKAPLKYAGLHPWEILVSEAQERMSLSVDKKKIKDLMELAAMHNVEISVIGTFNDSGFFKATWKKETVCLLDMDFMHNGLPEMKLEARWTPPSFPEPPEKTLETMNTEETLYKLMGALNIASKEHWVRQYDHEVQAGSTVKPFCGLRGDGPSDCAVIRPLYDHRQGLVISNGIAPGYSDIDTYEMARHAVDEAVRAAVAGGGDPDKITGLDNFCWPDPVDAPDNPKGSYKMAQLVRANKGLHEACLDYQMPLISGKDSMKNDYGRGESMISIPPTLLITAVTTIPDTNLALSSDLKENGNLVYLLGKTYPELGGSELYKLLGFTGRKLPPVKAVKNRRLYKTFFKGVKGCLIRSSHDVSDGGLLPALTEMCIGGKKGMEIDISNLTSDMKMYQTLFSESAGRIIAEVTPKNRRKFEKLFKNDPCFFLGTVKTEYTLDVKNNGKIILSADITKAEKSWKKTLQF